LASEAYRVQQIAIEIKNINNLFRCNRNPLISNSKTINNANMIIPLNQPISLGNFAIVLATIGLNFHLEEKLMQIGIKKASISKRKISI